MTRIQVEQVSYRIAERFLVCEASFEVRPGELLCILGLNGAGKTTLLRLAMGLLSPTSGRVLLDGVAARELPPRQRAYRVSYLPQAKTLAWPNRVRDVVSLGRFANARVFGRLNDSDEKAIDKAMRACDVASLAERSVDTLSGGELARVHCARVFASSAPCVVADEPTSALDPLHQHQVMALFRKWVDDGNSVIVVLHDISLAAHYADKLLWLKDGKIVSLGPVGNTLTTERIADVYGVRARVANDAGVFRVVVEGQL